MIFTLLSTAFAENRNQERQDISFSLQIVPMGLLDAGASDSAQQRPTFI